MVRKLDFNVLFVICSMALFASMADFDVGLANSAGIAADLGISDDQWQLALSLFYFLLSLFECPTLCWAVLPAGIYAPAAGIAIGVLHSCLAAVQGFSGFAAVRCLLAVAIAAFLPGVPLYLTFFYYRQEISSRMAFFMSIKPLAFTVSGLLAMGISWAPRAIDSWRIMFLTYGLPMILFSLVAAVLLPSEPQRVFLLTEHERQIALSRTYHQIGRSKRIPRVDLRKTGHVLRNIRNLIAATMLFFINIARCSFSVMPKIIEGMGFEGPPQDQGLMAPPFFTAFLVVLFGGWLSNRLHNRGFFVTGGALISSIGFLILAASTSQAARYFSLFLICPGVFAALSALIAWIGNNQTSENRRALAYWILQFIGQTGNILGTRLFRFGDFPLYRKGAWFSFGAMLLVCFLSLVEISLLYRDNKRLDEKYGHADRAKCKASDRALTPETFRYYL